MFLFHKDNHALLTVLVSIFCIVIMVLVLQIKIIASYFSFAQEVNGLEPRISRLAGLIESEARLQSLEQMAKDELSFFVYPYVTENNVTGAQMQQSLRTLFKETGMTIVGSQILKLKESRGFTRVGVSLTLTGEMDALESSLMLLESQGPSVFIDEINISPKRSRRRRGSKSAETQILDVKLKLISFKSEVS